MHRKAIALLPVLALVGCGADEGTPFFEVGTGESTFEALGEGATVPLIHGPQGGYHVWLGVRHRGLGPGDVILEYGARDATTREELMFPGLRAVQADVDPEAVSQTAGLVGFLLEDEPLVYDGRPIRLWARATDAGGQALSDERGALVEWGGE